MQLKGLEFVANETFTTFLSVLQRSLWLLFFLSSHRKSLWFYLHFEGHVKGWGIFECWRNYSECRFVNEGGYLLRTIEPGHKSQEAHTQREGSMPALCSPCLSVVLSSTEYLPVSDTNEGWGFSASHRLWLLQGCLHGPLRGVHACYSSWKYGSGDISACTWTSVLALNTWHWFWLLIFVHVFNTRTATVTVILCNLIVSWQQF